MSIYLIIWISLSVFLLVFWAWSTAVLFRQKRGWKQFAQKYKIRYRGNNLFDSPDLSGSVDGYKVIAFTSDHSDEDARLGHRLTCIEVSLKTALPVSCAVASGGMVKIVEELSFQYEYRPEIKGWDNSYIARSKDDDLMRAYLTDDRLKALIKLMKIKNSWIILLFSSGQGLLRIDLPDPLDDPKNLEKHIKMMVNTAKILEIGDGELNKMTSKKKTKDMGLIDLNDTHEIFDKPAGLTLEDDE